MMEEIAEKAAVRLEISALAVVNYALQQNRVPAIRSIHVINEGRQPLENVQLSIHAVPALCLPFQKHFDQIPAGSTFSAGAIDLKLDGEFLSSLTEKTTGRLCVQLQKDEEILAEENLEITALAFDEWHGYGMYPELLSAFVTPNHPQIVKLTARASELLAKWTGDPSLDAYQTRDPNRVLRQAAAVYGAIQEQNIVYSVPPASFEPAGQRVRLCDTVISQKMGTCLDLTLLYAACIEAIGLNPILVLQQGHIFPGIWLEDMTFPESVQDDTSLITKRLASGISEIAVVEATCMVAGKNCSFDTAASAAEQLLTSADAVEYIIDVRRARLSGVSPLPQRISTDAGWKIIRPILEEDRLTDAPQDIGGVVTIDETGPKEPVTKQVQWERKLLDLGMRNALINMRLSRTIVPILTASLDMLENALSDGSDFSIFSRPGDYQISGGLNFENMHELQGNEALIQSEFKSKRLRSAYNDTELTKALKELYRSAKTAMEENGANTLYLAMGLLRWFETPRSTKPRFAPIVLLPVEMVRKSAAQGYVIRLRDDEAQINITMLEKIKQDFGIEVHGLDPVPTDEHGLDIRKIFTILRKAVMGQARWDVLESAYLGIFSFSQFVMWNDIRNRSADLQRNKIVRSLMDGKLSWQAQDMAIGDTVDEEGAYLPLSADASQLFAIEAACRGDSFVLHGPPGTGKSQTITTMIANALAQDRTVLFVAEKMAALEVVEKRLNKIGLGPFCLELHSNKAKKRAVLEQLRLATEVTKNTSPAEYAARAQQIAQVRKELTRYAKALHQPSLADKSLFDLVNLYEQYAQAPDIKAFSPEYVRQLTGEDLTRQETVMEQMIAAARAVGHPHDHPLETVCCTLYSQQIRHALPQALADYEAAISSLTDPLKAFAAGAGLEVSSYRSILHALEVCRSLQLWLNLPKKWAAEEDLHRCLTDIRQMAGHYLKAREIKEKLLQLWKPEFLELNAKELCLQYDAADAKWFLPRALGIGKIWRKVRIYAAGAVNKEDLRTHLRQLSDYQKEKAAGDGLFSLWGGSLGKLYQGADTDYAAVMQAADAADAAQQQLAALRADGLRGRAYALADEIYNLLAVCGNFTAAREKLYSLLALSCDPNASDHLANQLQVCSRIRQHSGELKDWIAFNATAEEAALLGLGDVVDAYRGGISHDEILPAYRKAVYKAMAMVVIDDNEALCTFSGAVFNEKIRQFKRLDEELATLTQQQIYCHLASKVPDFAKEAASSSELGILQRAIRSGGRGISIRKLFEQLPNLLPRLCPCMLMSPISAAQYLDPARKPFDLVVFDEASQLPTCKAVGALARGENAVIVGDPKQMPPTAFFVNSTVDEDNLEAEDLESILDDCLALNMPQTHLLWHYRSRHESLIAFSNRTFYENKLFTFPSVNDRATMVSLVHVDGVFERGKLRQNRAEAEAVIQELKRRCHDPELAQYSVGVVTFNISQQHLIDDLLQEACREDPALDTWAYQSGEPIFIKNLENVQGDERDVILFSVGYGPDENGKVYMNFGPLNRDGGWRRLNVAITRSRREMIVFSTLRPEQIDLTRTTAQGVSALKAFLEYAESQKLPQDENTIRRSMQEKEGIAHTICQYLAHHGYDTARNVGHSEYRIDIGVIDPKNPDQYCLGILLDGEGYGSSKTARDREIAQIGVLQGLGWRITRVWTMDWWDNSPRELARLLQLLQEPPQAPQEPEAPLPELPPILAGQPVGKASTPHLYTPAELNQSSITPDELLLPKYAAAIRRKVASVISREAPICRSLLTRRVVQSYGITRAGSRIQNYLEHIYNALGLKATEQGDEVFYWTAEQDPDTYCNYRAGATEEARRDAKEIPVQEAAAAVCQVLTEQISLNEEDLIRESAKLLGYTRLGTAVTLLIQKGIGYAQVKNRIALDSRGHYILA